MSELEEIEARIERDRAELGRSLGKLSDTLSAGGLTAKLDSAAKSSGGAIARQAIDVAKSNPAAFALAAAGLGLFLAHSANRHSKTGEPTLAAGSQPPASDDTPSNGKADRITKPAPSASSLRAEMERGLEDLPPAARARVLEARVAALQAQEKVEARSSNATSGGRRLFNAFPLAAGVAAFGAGAALAAFTSRRQGKGDTLSKRRDALLSAARQALNEERQALHAPVPLHPEGRPYRSGSARRHA